MKTKAPMDIMMDSVNWEDVDPMELEQFSEDDELPYVIRKGVFNIANVSLRCYVLSDGSRILNAKDVENLFS